jgi:hypothetical protein
MKTIAEAVADLVGTPRPVLYLDLGHCVEVSRQLHDAGHGQGGLNVSTSSSDFWTDRNTTEHPHPEFADDLNLDLLTTDIAKRNCGCNPLFVIFASALSWPAFYVARGPLRTITVDVVAGGWPKGSGATLDRRIVRPSID